MNMTQKAEALDGKDQSQRQQKFVELLAKIEQEQLRRERQPFSFFSLKYLGILFLPRPKLRIAEAFRPILIFQILPKHRL